MCGSVRAFFLLIVATVVVGHPAKDELMFDVGDDTAVVESTVREARAAVPEHIEDLLHPGVKEAFLHTYGDKKKSNGDVQGYRKRSQDKGNDGYKHFDSYHKKDGDKYGYETQKEYGQKNKAGAAGSGKSKKYKTAGGRNADGAETKASYKVTENVKENKKGVSALEDYDGDSGYYVDSGESEGYTDADSENYEDGDEGESEGGDSENYVEGEGDDSGYEAEEGDEEGGNYEYDDAESESEDYY